MQFFWKSCLKFIFYFIFIIIFLEFESAVLCKIDCLCNHFTFALIIVLLDGDEKSNPSIIAAFKIQSLESCKFFSLFYVAIISFDPIGSSLAWLFARLLACH